MGQIAFMQLFIGSNQDLGLGYTDPVGSSAISPAITMTTA